MISIQEVKKLFPIYSNRLKISVLNSRDISVYAAEIQKPYFSKYMDTKRVLEMSDDEVKLGLKNIIAKYKLNIPFIYELRLILRNSNNDIIGGVTLYPFNINQLEVAYWIVEKHQNNGYAAESLQSITEFILNKLSHIDFIYLEIQEANKRSIKVAEKCGYTHIKNVDGAFGVNRIYGYWR